MRNPLEFFARIPVPYAQRGYDRALSPLFSTVEFQLRAMEVNPTINGLVGKTSTATAAEEWHLHRKRKGATCDVCEEVGVENVESHAALKVWNKPNPFFTRQELVEAGQQHGDLTGETWVVVGRMGSVPVQLWNVSPARVEVVTSPSEYLLGYIYRAPGGEEVPIRREDMLFNRIPNPSDPYRGLSPLLSVMPNIASTRAAFQWQRKFFENSAQPGGLIKVPKRLHDREWRELLTRWEESHRGVNNAGRVGILEGEAEWIDNKITQRDMTFVDLIQLDKESIRETYGMSKFAMGIVDDVNRATADASAAWFGESMTIPRLDRWKGLLNNDYLPQFPAYDPLLSFVYSSPVPADRSADREDKKALVEEYVAMVSSGIDPDDAADYLAIPRMRFTKPAAAPQPAEQEAVA